MKTKAQKQEIQNQAETENTSTNSNSDYGNTQYNMLFTIALLQFKTVHLSTLTLLGAHQILHTGRRVAINGNFCFINFLETF